MKPSKTKEIGDFGERHAANYLRLHGYWIKERNYRSGKHEIDIIATNLKDVAFVEVKTRTYRPESIQDAPPPHLAVHSDKQRCTRLAAQHYLYTHPTKKQPRMDVIEIWLLKSPDKKKPKVYRIHHIKAAY